MGNNECEKCNSITETSEISSFRKHNNNKFSSTCKKCLNEKDKINKKNTRIKKLETTLVKCEKCNTSKVLSEFAKLKKFYKKKICKTCYPDFLNEQKKEWCSNERKCNINYRLKKSLAARLRNVLKKDDTTMNYIGCNIQYLREWIEFNFTKEMNWDNYGSYWSIDHIIPVCKFDLTNEDDKIKCWKWSNMMPTTIKFSSSKKDIDIKQVNYIIERLEKFKEEGSTTKWFSKEFLINNNNNKSD
jgi:hypothetical protein